MDWAYGKNVVTQLTKQIFCQRLVDNRCKETSGLDRGIGRLERRVRNSVEHN